MIAESSIRPSVIADDGEPTEWRPRDKTVLIAGATSAAGRAVAQALLDAGARVIAVGSDEGRIDALEPSSPGVIGERADLTDGDDVLELAMRVHARVGDRSTASCTSSAAGAAAAASSGRPRRTTACSSARSPRCAT